MQTPVPALIHSLTAMSKILDKAEAFADAAEGRAPYPVPQSQMIANISALEAIFKSAATGAIVQVES